MLDVVNRASRNVQLVRESLIIASISQVARILINSINYVARMRFRGAVEECLDHISALWLTLTIGSIAHCKWEVLVLEKGLKNLGSVQLTSLMAVSTTSTLSPSFSAVFRGVLVLDPGVGVRAAGFMTRWGVDSGVGWGFRLILSVFLCNL